MCTGMEIGMMALSGAGQFLNMRMQQQQAAMQAQQQEQMVELILRYQIRHVVL